MSLSADRVSRGRRVQEIQAEWGEDNNAFAARLNATAVELGLPATWHPARLSKVRNGTQDLSVEDATILARLDKQQRGYTYVAYGIPVTKGEDAWVVLARMAKKRQGKTA